jgi:TatD DNase family protein
MSNLFLVDSHCHLDRLDLTSFEGNLQNALEEAKASHVGYFLNVCVHPNTIPTLLSIAAHRSDMAISIGLHPTEDIEQEPTLDQLKAWAAPPKVVALGETGLDYYRKADKAIQQARFRNHIRAAKAVNKPLIIHTRHAIEDTLTILREEEAHTVGGVLHCFNETLEMAQTAIEQLGFYISFSGVLTFQKADSLREIARQLPLNRLLIETDSPYLTPEPFRGKQTNHPAYVRYVAHSLAKLHNISFKEIAQQTSDNFFQLFQHAHRPTNTTIRKN